MQHILLYENFTVNADYIPVYHGTPTEEAAKGILSRGYDTSLYYGGRVEGVGMGAFFSPEDAIYGNYLVEFHIPRKEFERSIVIYTDKTEGTEPQELAMSIHGKVETLAQQLKRINGNTNLLASYSPICGWLQDDLGRVKGWATDYRFPGILSLHLRDPRIAKPVRYFAKN
jgi:hypothetical protein